MQITGTEIKRSDHDCLFLFVLFNDAVCSSVYVVLNASLINAWWIRNNMEGNSRALIDYVDGVRRLRTAATTDL
jgi:hypothetical protein